MTVLDFSAVLSDDAAVGVEILAIDPAGRSSKERHDFGYVGRCAESLEWGLAAHSIGGLLVLSVEK